MKNARIITILALVALCATSASAFDLPSTAAVEIVEGITVTQVTGMDFGQVALHDGALVLSTDPLDALTDVAHISYDDAGYSPAIFTVDSIASAVLTANITDGVGGNGLVLSAFTVSVDGGTSDETVTAIPQATASETWNVGCTLTVDAGVATVGATTAAYNVNVTMN